jgi:hypothetical protein
MKRKLKPFATVALAFALVLGCSAAAVAAAPCDVRLALTLTPDVPNPQDPGFLGAILSSPQYQLTWISGSDTQATVQLTGPGPGSQCQQAVDKLSRDSHVLRAKVLGPGEANPGEST